MGNQTLCAAIRGRQVVKFRYKNEIRTVEPHAVGYDADGDLTLSAWQTSGTSPGWRDFHVAKLSGLAITEANFEKPRSGYNPNDTTLSRVLCRL